ncbi:hypothetical protein SLEP1_g44419 [Rubroshorea leprosula]|uniref:Uncharacterized protein n=1 Tax=Rubroshorea leprosula TaxID=152421 RepID=A0AAV5LGQ5_9ROSI|nr:hypothetical protein SLEP1_g44419 [Rubroshorea leprosula]
MEKIKREEGNRIRREGEGSYRDALHSRSKRSPEKSDSGCPSCPGEEVDFILEMESHSCRVPPSVFRFQALIL